MSDRGKVHGKTQPDIAMSTELVKELILSAIDQLRRRKARPDLERITHMLQRKHRVPPKRTEACLERLVDAEIVTKVEYKGNYSYRNSAKWRRSHLGGVILNSTSVSRKLLEAVQALCTRTQAAEAGQEEGRTAGQGEGEGMKDGEGAKEGEGAKVGERSEVKEGASASEVEKWMEANAAELMPLKSSISVALQREVDTRRLAKLPNGNFIVAARDTAETDSSLDSTPGAEEGAGSSSSRETSVKSEPSSPSASAPLPSLPSPGAEAPTPQEPTPQNAAAATPAADSTEGVNPENPAPQSATPEGATSQASTPQAPTPQVETPLPANPQSATSATPQAADPATPSTSASPGSFNLPKAFSAPSKLQPAVPAKRGRPPKKKEKICRRGGKTWQPVKKVRRSDGDRGDVKPAQLPVAAPPRCDYCMQTEERNRYGFREALLFCKDCTAKAHPTCMDYTDELAARARLKPWQCIDCKNCIVCYSPGDPSKMLFCDGCDMGYHMGCHNPSVAIAPEDKWICGSCEAEGVTLELLEEDAERLNAKKVALLPTAPPVNRRRRKRRRNNNEAEAVQEKKPFLEAACVSPVAGDEASNHNGSAMNGRMEPEQSRRSVLSRVPVLEGDKYPDASEWGIEDVVSFFRSAGFEDQCHAFRQQEIDGRSLLLMKRSDVLTGLSIKLGPALKINRHVQNLQAAYQQSFH